MTTSDASSDASDIPKTSDASDASATSNASDASDASDAPALPDARGADAPRGEDGFLWVFVVSDGTGDTGSAAVRAGMIQFPERWRLRVFRDTRSISDVHRVMEEAERYDALVVFSLVEGAVVEALRHEAEMRGVTAVDLLGPLIMRVAQRLHMEPRHQPGLLHGFTDDYFVRIEAVEFAVRHDDGANLHTLHEADIVLTGVSRTSKTPLSMYLAQRGYKTGNVPLVPELEPPSQLLEVDPRRVFGLTVDPGTLLSVRSARLRTMKAPGRSSYTDPDQVMLELDRARRLFRARGWRMIDVSGRAVEENASRIIDAFEFAGDERRG